MSDFDSAKAGEACPCGSGEGFAACCGRYLEGGEAAPTAEALMRSRFTAYARRDYDYLTRSWHPATRPEGLKESSDSEVEWTALEVVERAAGGEGEASGEVEFIAHYRYRGADHSLRERSRFVREEGRWYYLDGREPPARRDTAKVGRNDPCPCGSGKKFKKCCGR